MITSKRPQDYEDNMRRKCRALVKFMQEQDSLHAERVKRDITGLYLGWKASLLDAIRRNQESYNGTIDMLPQYLLKERQLRNLAQVEILRVRVYQRQYEIAKQRKITYGRQPQ